VIRELRTEDGEGWAGLVADLTREAMDDAEVVIFEAGTVVSNRIKTRLTGQRSGRVYRVPETSTRTYTASAPGESPASVTGALRNSIAVSAVRRSADSVEVDVGVGAAEGARGLPYARRLEYGGFHTQAKDQTVRGESGWFAVKAGTLIRTAPRPYLRPGFEEARAEVDHLLRRLMP
jgi:hypothetical protein